MNQDTRTRALDLLCDRAVQGLSPDEERELSNLLSLHPDLDDSSVDLAAAAVALNRLGDEEPIPDTVRMRVQQAATAQVRRPSPARGNRGFHPAWLAAAAALVLAFAGWWQVWSPTTTSDPTESRQALLPTATVQLEWTATEDPAAVGAVGNVVWSDDRQEGYMMMEGLAANDPTQEQYQLWIFPADGDARYPVDGGVFDVPPGSDTVVIPIDAKIAVEEPVLFAITVEKPGGVVVSQRDRIVLLAQVGG